MDQAIIEIAKEFKSAKEAGNYHNGFVIGTVVTGLPNLSVQTDPEIIVKKDKLIVADYLLSGYKRDVTLRDEYTRNYELEYRDSIKVGEKLILIPNGDNNVYVAIGKAVFL